MIDDKGNVLSEVWVVLDNYDGMDSCWVFWNEADARKKFKAERDGYVGDIPEGTDPDDYTIEEDTYYFGYEVFDSIHPVCGSIFKQQIR